MPQPLYEKVWVEDNWLARVGLFLDVKHAAFCRPVQKTKLETVMVLWW